MKKIINYLLIVISSLIVGCGTDTSELELMVLEGSETTISSNQSDSEEFKEESSNEYKEESSVMDITVYICGAVNKPGVYTFSEGTRIACALDEAGGYSSDAHTTYMNLAQLLVDGEKIYVPTQKEVDSGELLVGVHSAGNETGLININTATKEELLTLSGVGESKANAIITYRNDYGKYGSMEDIKNVSGIGDGVFNTIKDFITV